MASGMQEGQTEPRLAEVETIVVADWAEFQRELEPYLDAGYLFRGVCDRKYDLRPKIGRTRYLQACDPSEERRLLNLFKRQAAPFFPVRPQNDWEWLAVAQHHGVPTRLLDWSENPLVSTYFAVWDDNPASDEADGALYVLKRPLQYTEIAGGSDLLDPFAVKELVFIYAPHIFPRIALQHGLFTVHQDPKLHFESSDLRRLVIPSREKERFRIRLDTLGLSHATIFGTLDGLSRRIDWQFARRAAAAILSPEPSPLSPSPAAAAVQTSGSTGPSPAAPAYPLPNIRYPYDPQRARWGKKATRGSWTVDAEVSQDRKYKDWFEITVQVSGPAVDGSARFHLHPTFREQVVERPIAAGRTTLILQAYGAFTIGVEVHPAGGAMVPLELNLARIGGAPDLFRER